MNTKSIILTTALFSTMILACDEGSPDDELEVGELDLAHPERIIASVEPDPDTKIYFIESGVEGEDGVDVVILGRDGGRDYGGLIARDQATPLELYVAFADNDQPIPEALSRDHDRQRGAVEQLDILKPAEASALQDDSWENIQSTFTCLNWTNYQSYMATRFSSEADRVETLSSYSEWHEVKAPTDGTSYWDASQADMVVCNKESSSSPGYNDTVISAACVTSLGIPPLEDCLYVPLDDGHYLRRLYAETSGWRRYRAAASPTSASNLQTYIGIVGNPE
jgi:hypothetical protein